MGTRHELGMSWIVPMLPHLRERLPHVLLDLYFGSGPDLEQRLKTFDLQCAVTSRLTTDPALDATRLTREDFAFVGAPSLLQHTPLSTIEDARHHTLVDVHSEAPLFRYFRDSPEAPDSMRFAAHRNMGAIAAIRAVLLTGVGVAVLPLHLIERDLECGTLVRLFPRVHLISDHFRLMYRRHDPKAALYESIAAVMKEIELT
jgi:DNA-binding transcriptional LysR family regulator